MIAGACVAATWQVLQRLQRRHTASATVTICGDASPFRGEVIAVDLLDELMMHHVKIRRFRIDQRAINHVSLPFKPWLT